MATVTTPQIRLDDKGVAWIEGTTAKVIEIALTQMATGWAPDELQRELPHLSIAQIDAALAYYHSHKAELDAEIERRERWVEQMEAQAEPSPFAQRLRAMGKLP